MITPLTKLEHLTHLTRFQFELVPTDLLLPGTNSIPFLLLSITSLCPMALKNIPSHTFCILDQISKSLCYNHQSTAWLTPPPRITYPHITGPLTLAQLLSHWSRIQPGPNPLIQPGLTLDLPVRCLDARSSSANLFSSDLSFLFFHCLMPPYEAS